MLQSVASRSLYPVINSWPTSSRTAETLLVRRDDETILFLNYLRHLFGTCPGWLLPDACKWRENDDFGFVLKQPAIRVSRFERELREWSMILDAKHSALQQTQRQRIGEIVERCVAGHRNANRAGGEVGAAANFFAGKKTCECKAFWTAHSAAQCFLHDTQAAPTGVRFKLLDEVLGIHLMTGATIITILAGDPVMTQLSSNDRMTTELALMTQFLPIFTPRMMTTPVPT